MKQGLVIIFFLFVSSCSSQDVKRATYHTLDNLGKQQCQRETLSDCADRPQNSFEDYQKQREEEVKQN